MAYIQIRIFLEQWKFSY